MMRQPGMRQHGTIRQQQGRLRRRSGTALLQQRRQQMQMTPPAAAPRCPPSSGELQLTSAQMFRHVRRCRHAHHAVLRPCRSALHLRSACIHKAHIWLEPFT